MKVIIDPLHVGRSFQLTARQAMETYLPQEVIHTIVVMADFSDWTHGIRCLHQEYRDKISWTPVGCYLQYQVRNRRYAKLYNYRSLHDPGCYTSKIRSLQSLELSINHLFKNEDLALPLLPKNY